MKYNGYIIFIMMIVIFILNPLCLQANNEGAYEVVSSTENATTLEYYLTKLRAEEMKIAGLNNSNPLELLPDSLEKTDYTSLINACVSKINDERIQYSNGQVNFLNTASNSLIAIGSILSLCGVGLCIALLKKEGSGFSLAKSACSGLTIGFATLTLAEIVKKLRKESYASFSGAGLSYTIFDKKNNMNNYNCLVWPTVKYAHIARTVKIDKVNRDVIEHINTELRDESNKVLLSFTNIYFPVQVERFLELVSYFKAKAASLESNSLPMVIETERFVI